MNWKILNWETNNPVIPSALTKINTGKAFLDRSGWRQLSAEISLVTITDHSQALCWITRITMEPSRCELLINIERMSSQTPICSYLELSGLHEKSILDTDILFSIYKSGHRRLTVHAKMKWSRYFCSCHQVRWWNKLKFASLLDRAQREAKMGVMGACKGNRQ